MTRAICYILPFCSLSPKISEGYLILKIIYSVTKYLIKQAVVYFLSSASTLKNSNDLFVCLFDSLRPINNLSVI